MPRITPDDLRRTISVWVRFAPQSARVAYASKHPIARDKGGDAISKAVCDRFERAEWTVHTPHVPGVQRDSSPDTITPVQVEIEQSS